MTAITALIPQLAGPRDAAPLHRKGCHEPVQPERRPYDSEDQLDRMHSDPDRHCTWRVHHAWLGIRPPPANRVAFPVPILSLYTTPDPLFSSLPKPGEWPPGLGLGRSRSHDTRPQGATQTRWPRAG